MSIHKHNVIKLRDWLRISSFEAASRCLVLHRDGDQNLGSNDDYGSTFRPMLAMVGPHKVFHNLLISEVMNIT